MPSSPKQSLFFRLTISMKQGPSWEANSDLDGQEIPPPPTFILYEGSFPWSQGSATGPYPESDESSQKIPNFFP